MFSNALVLQCYTQGCTKFSKLENNCKELRVNNFYAYFEMSKSLQVDSDFWFVQQIINCYKINIILKPQLYESIGVNFYTKHI
jgi:hypothetical protein